MVLYCWSLNEESYSSKVEGDVAWNMDLIAFYLNWIELKDDDLKVEQ